MKIFMAYAPSEQQMADRLVLSLSEQGHQVMADPEDYPRGKTNIERTHKAIHKADIFLFLASRASLQSGSLTLAALEAARKARFEQKDKILVVEVEPLPQIPDHLQNMTIIQPEGEVVSEIANQIYFEDRQRKARRLIYRSLAAVLAFCIALTTVIVGMMIGPDSDLMNVGNPRFEVRPEVATLQWNESVTFELVNLNPAAAGNFQVAVSVPENNPNITSITSDQKGRQIQVQAAFRPFVNWKKGFQAYQDGYFDFEAEDLKVVVLNDRQEPIWQSPLMVGLMNTSLEFGLSGLDIQQKHQMARFNRYTIQRGQTRNVRITYGEEELPVGFEVFVQVKPREITIEKQGPNLLVFEAGNRSTIENTTLRIEHFETGWKATFRPYITVP